MERGKDSGKFPINTKLPEFSLPNVDGRQIDSSYFKNSPALIVFTCNHCPYVKGSEEMLIETVEFFQKNGLKAAEISSNDAVNYPEDSFEKMKERAKEMNLSYPYLYDESQKVARLFDAECTPECYLFDSKGLLVFHGTVNDSLKDPSKVKKRYLHDALSQLFSGKAPDPAFVHPMGCSIKWRFN